MTHPTDLLADLVAGTLADEVASAVTTHVAGCPTCAEEVAAWGRVADTLRAEAAAVAPPPVGLLDTLRARIAPVVVLPVYRAPLGTRAIARLPGLLIHQLRLAPRLVWLVAAALVASGVAAALWTPDAVSGHLLAAVAPFAAALAVAGACGGTDPTGEIVAASPTSVRTILMARLAVVLGIVFGAAVAASLAAALVIRIGPGQLLTAWLGPMALLSAITFALSALLRTGPALGVATTLWGLRALAGSGLVHNGLSAALAPLWQTTVPTLVVAVALVAGTVALAPRLRSAGPRQHYVG